jgi:hypothetical protein
MTTPAPVTISYGHTWLDDCTEDSVGDWASVEDGQTLEDFVVLKDDVFDAEASASIGNKKGYWDTNVSNLESTAYAKFRWRVKCSNASIKVGITLVFDDATVQDILADVNTTVWKAGSGNIIAGKTIIHVRFWVDAAIGHVYIDFMMVYKGDFNFPNTGRGISFMGQGRFARPAPPGASGAETENLGSELAEIIAECDLDLGTWTRAGDVVPGQVFFDIMHNSKTEDFQWLDTGELAAQFKCTLEKHDLHNEVQGNNDTRHLVQLTIYEYRRGPANDETEVERWGLNL